MTIKNKNGEIYQLQKPNPIMKGQEIWDDYILHNFNSNSEVKPTDKIEVEIKEIEPPKKKYQNIEEIIPQEIIVPIKETPIEKPKKPKEPDKTLLYCMPAITTIKHDKLYNEDRINISYEAQFTLESVITKSEDLICEMWINTDKVTENSILYMPKTLRWWKVEKVTDNNNGYIIVCSPSTIQPSFALI